MDFYQLVVPDALNLEGETREASPEVTYHFTSQYT